MEILICPLEFRPVIFVKKINVSFIIIFCHSTICKFVNSIVPPDFYYFLVNCTGLNIVEIFAPILVIIIIVRALCVTQKKKL